MNTKEKHRIYMLGWRKKNSDKNRAMSKRWKLNNPDYVNNFRCGGLRIKVLERDGYACVQCGMTAVEHRAKWNRAITIDHVDGNGRYSKRPNNKLSNLNTMCLSCHGAKDHPKGNSYHKHQWEKP